MNTPSNEVTKGRQPHVHAALIKAWADGARIQCDVSGRGGWVDCPTPSWLNEVIYRIKPKPQVKKYRWVYFFIQEPTRWKITEGHYQNKEEVMKKIGSQYMVLDLISYSMIEVEDES